MSWVRGIVKSYDPVSGKGLIALAEGGDDVRVDFVGTRGIRLAKGQQVEIERIERPCGVYVSGVRVIA